MDAAIAAFPILPGATTELKRLSDDLSGNRFEEHRLARRALGVNRERWWTNEDEGIGFVMVEGPGAGEAASAFTAASTPYVAWYLSRLAAAVPGDADWRHAFSATSVYLPPTSAQTLGQSTVLAFPMAPGMSAAWRALGEQAGGAHRDAIEDFHSRMGLRETWWLLSEPEGDIALMQLESNDLVGAVCTLADSMNVVDLWLRQKFLEIHGVDWRAGIPARMSQLVLDWTDESMPRRVIRLDAEAAVAERQRR
jgi:hypothetical protein